MQVSAPVILDFRNEVSKFAMALSESPRGSKVEVGSQLADQLKGISQNDQLRPKNITDILDKYIIKFTDDLVLKGIDNRASKRIAKEVAERVLNDTMLEIQG